MPDTQNSVKLRGYYRYDSGSPYRIWTLMRDFPSIQASLSWQEDFDGPPHAIAGDELWEDIEAQSNYFRLKRDDIVIARPEWWQIGDLVFGGCKPRWSHPRRKRTRGSTFAAGAAQVYEDAAKALEGVLEKYRNPAEPTGTQGTQRNGPARGTGGAFLEPYTVRLTNGRDVEGSYRFIRPARLNDRDIPVGSYLMPIPGKQGIGRDPDRLWGEWSIQIGPKYDDSIGMLEHRAAGIMDANEVHSDTTAVSVLRSLGIPLHPIEERAASVDLVLRDMPQAGVRRGDVLIFGEPDVRPAVVRSNVREMTLDDYEALRSGFDEHAGDQPILRNISPWCVWWGRGATYFIRHKNGWGKQLKVWRSRLVHVRPLRSAVSSPIEAATDAHALFELLTQVGRLPQS